MDDSSFLMMSGIQHFCFCIRQWALIHLEQQWAENYLTVAGDLAHERVHDPQNKQSRKGYFTCSALRVSSSVLMLSGICDLVEFSQSDDGISVPGHQGYWTVVPVEYKHGDKELVADKIQLCCQAIALEEMFNCSIPEGFIYHVKSRKREKVTIDAELRKLCLKTASKMHEMYIKSQTPAADYSKKCDSCSLNDICLPLKNKQGTVADYIKRSMYEKDA